MVKRCIFKQCSDNLKAVLCRIPGKAVIRAASSMLSVPLAVRGNNLRDSAAATVLSPCFLPSFPGDAGWESASAPLTCSRVVQLSWMPIISCFIASSVAKLSACRQPWLRRNRNRILRPPTQPNRRICNCAHAFLPLHATAAAAMAVPIILFAFPPFRLMVALAYAH